MKFLRLPVQVFLYIFEWILTIQEIIFIKLFYKETLFQYKRIGSCAQTGSCCKFIGVKIPDYFLRFSLLKKLAIWWYGFRFHFHFLEAKNNVLIYSCNYLKNNKCEIYRFRPKLCRDYPKNLPYGKIKLYKGCGYEFISTRKKQNLDEFLSDAKKRDQELKEMN